MCTVIITFRSLKFRVKKVCAMFFSAPSELPLKACVALMRIEQNFKLPQLTNFEYMRKVDQVGRTKKNDVGLLQAFNKL